MIFRLINVTFKKNVTAGVTSKTFILCGFEGCGNTVTPVIPKNTHLYINLYFMFLYSPYIYIYSVTSITSVTYIRKPIFYKGFRGNTKGNTIK